MDSIHATMSTPPHPTTTTMAMPQQTPVVTITPEQPTPQSTAPLPSPSALVQDSSANNHPSPRVTSSTPLGPSEPVPVQAVVPVTLHDIQDALVHDARRELAADPIVRNAQRALGQLVSGPSNAPAIIPGQPLSLSQLRDAAAADAHRRLAASSPVLAAHQSFNTAVYGASATSTPLASPPVESALSPGLLRDAVAADAHRRLAVSSPIQSLHNVLSNVVAGPSERHHDTPPPPPEKGGFFSHMKGAMKETFIHEGHRLLANDPRIRQTHANMSSYVGSHASPSQAPQSIQSHPAATHSSHAMAQGTYSTQNTDLTPIAGPSGTPGISSPGILRTASPQPIQYLPLGGNGTGTDIGLPPQLINIHHDARRVSDPTRRQSIPLESLSVLDHQSQSIHQHPHRSMTMTDAYRDDQRPMIEQRRSSAIMLPPLAYTNEDPQQTFRLRGQRGMSGTSRRTGTGTLDYVIPRSEAGSDPGGEKTIRDSGFHFPTERLSLALRLKPTIEHARFQQGKLKMKAHYSGLAINIAIGLQVFFGALVTGIAAAVDHKKAGLITSIFGGILTMLATYLAKVRGSGEPERSRARSKDFANFIRDAEAACMDRGWIIERRKPGETDEEFKDEVDHEVERFRVRFEELMASLNNSQDQRITTVTTAAATGTTGTTANRV